MGLYGITQKISKLSMLVASIILLLLWNSLRSNLSEDFETTEKDLLSGQAVLLDDHTQMSDIKSVILRHAYTDANGAQFIAQQLDSMLKENKLNDLDLLHKNKWKAPQASVEASKSTTHQQKLAVMITELEQNDAFEAAETSTQSSTITVKGSGTEYITARVADEHGESCPGVLVRLKQHITIDDQVQDTLLAWARTDNDGVVRFNGLVDTCSYSVLPVKRGFKYGNAQGTTHCDIATFRDQHSTLASYVLSWFTDKQDCNFTQLPLGVELFDNVTLRKIKEDNSFIVRTPEDFTKAFSGYFFGIMALWWIILIVASIMHRSIDTVLLASLMTLTEVSILMIYSLRPPLTGELLGNDTAMGVMIGIVVIAALQFFDIVGFYQGKLRLMGHTIPFDFIENRTRGRFNKGYLYLIVALLLTLALFPFGHEVGGMKVNLSIGFMFQPSEIAKYLIIIFMAAYFCQNSELITRYSEPGNYNLLGSKMRTLGLITLGMAFLIIMYVMLQDMGPAMVVIFTFLILYSMIKSRIDLDGKSADERFKAIMTCDLAMLIYGALSFGLLVWLSSKVHIAWLGALVWFVGWIAWGRFKRKQFIETPILFNLIVSVFVFSSLLASSDSSVLGKIGERLEQRTSMCVNTWGHLGLDGHQIEPAHNSQIAEGLWGLASGGYTGQGLGNSDSRFIPANHTDMMLQSIGENLGFAGILLIMAVYVLLLSHAIKAGYRSQHPFAMFLCTGIAIATAVQLFIIALGSTGVIPLTGITVPLLSSGKVSMILNLFAFGLVLSVSSRNAAARENATSKKYQYTLGLLNLAFCSIMLLVVGTFFRYQIFDRDDTLIRPLYVSTRSGEQLLEYNPRIAQLTRMMPMGDIYDRNGVLLATSRPSKMTEPHNLKAYSECGIKVDTNMVQTRYYPFAEHMFFMVGDFNSRLMFSNPYCYMAEYRLLDSIRGYDNRMRDKFNRLQRVNLPAYELADNTAEGRFTPHVTTVDGQQGVVLRDYSALLPYLKAGRRSQRVKDFIAGNEGTTLYTKIKPKDVRLTVDAVLQTRLQQQLEQHARNSNLGTNNLVRISAVVLDASNGDLLASANYPLPDYERLKSLPDNYTNYNDRIGLTDKNFKAYTDMDLGLSFATHPGSSAKVISALSGCMQLGDKMNNEIFYVAADQKVGADPVGNVSFYTAIVNSSNCYFINLVNKHNLYPSLEDIYAATGVRVNGASAYQLDYVDATPEWHAGVTRGYAGATDVYRTYLENYKAGRLKWPDTRMKGKKAHPAWMWCWGQGGLDATPAAMARVAATVVNNGVMPVTRYLCGDSVKKVKVTDKSLETLKTNMKAEANIHSHIGNACVGGKTGTAERIAGANGKTRNDAWYVCFYQSEDNKHRYAIAVRVERLPDRNYAAAVAAPIVRDIVLPTLKAHKYMD